jgi:hypothetical protein
LFASAIIKAVTLLPLARWGIAALPYSMMHASSFGVGRFLEHGFNWDAKNKANLISVTENK